MASKKVLFIGIDGMDPSLTEEFMSKGLLPNFLKLSKEGQYSRLATVTPPQSPVVWTSIATGCHPAEHGIHDFLGRDRKNYLPNLSILRLEKNKYVKPFTVKTFWEKASEKGTASVVLRWPLTFPAEQVTHASLLSGLGTPDIQGKLGTYTYYTTDTSAIPGDKKGRIVSLQCKNRRIATEIKGPFIASLTGMKESCIPFEIEINDGHIYCTVGRHSFDLYEGGWSDWIPLKFSLGLMRNIDGICRFYLKSIGPELNLYMTPMNIARATDNFPLSSPLSYSEALSDIIGPYATLGLPEDTNSLNDGLIDEDAFLAICNEIMDERERMFFHELGRFREGILACVFDTTDRIQHMFYRFIDKDHPMYDEALASKYGNVIADYYVRMNGIVGRALSMIDSDTALIICSDHGFTSFRKAVHLNTWLTETGFMSLKESKTHCDGLFDNVDWNKTRAYAVGLNSIYLNIKGREKNGILEGKEIASTKHELVDKLKSLMDNGIRVIRETYYTGKQEDDKPDLIVGYERNYRQSWQTAIGAVPAGCVIEENLKKWSGDHCCDGALVSGVFFTNQKNYAKPLQVEDISSLIMEAVGL